MLFTEIPAREEIRKRLVRTVAEQRVSHAQLFYGPEGSGKLALAIAYAQYLNCRNRGTGPDGLPDSCGQCPSCIQYGKLSHPDLHFVFPNNTTKKVTSKPFSELFIPEWREFLSENNGMVTLNGWYEKLGIENKQGTINVRDAEEILRKLSYKSYESEYKVMILWMVEKLYHAVAPKLLKILEEPPEKTLFLLITEDHSQVSPTIASRCLPVRIPPLLKSRGTDPEETRYFLTTFRQWMLQCHKKDIYQLIGFSADVAKIGREKQKSLLQYGLHVARNCAAYRYSGSMPEALPEEATFITRFSQFFPADKLGIFNDHFNEAIYHIERNAHGATLFLDLSLKMSRFFAEPAAKQVRS